MKTASTKSLIINYFLTALKIKTFKTQTFYEV